jgi:hypothetical protein
MKLILIILGVWLLGGAMLGPFIGLWLKARARPRDDDDWPRG